ncbi:MAG: type 1 glutamine amidotransferase [Candidatus Thorarchaeota archaeon]
MKKEVLIIKNITHENPGLISELLKEYRIRYDIIDLAQKVKFPDIGTYDLIIILGGPDSANDNSEKILRELDYINLALKKNIPVFGICLGLQLIVKVSGGKVYKNPIEEIGFKFNDKWFSIKLTEQGLKDPIFCNVEDNFIVFQLHGETVKLNENIKLLGTGEFCKNQIIKIGEYNYGFQFHFELTNKLLNEWTLLAPELDNIDRNQLFVSYNKIKKTYIERGKTIFLNYLKLIQLI